MTLREPPQTPDHRGTQAVVCPWCGYAYTDSWEIRDGEHECPACDRPFDLTIEAVPYYTTERVVRDGTE